MRPSLGWQYAVLTSFARGNVCSAPPHALLVDVTRRCNLRCVHCRTHSPLAGGRATSVAETDFPFERYLELIAEAGRMGIARLVLIGEGEPLLHPRLVDMVECSSAAGLEVILLTNGTLLEARHAAEFARAGLAELRVSLWAASEEEYEVLYPGSNRDLFRRAVEGLRVVSEARRGAGAARPRLVLHRPIERRFYRNVAATLDLARAAGCDEISFSPLKPLVAGDEARLLNEQAVAELVALLREVAGRAETAGIRHNVAAVLQRYRLGRDAWASLPCYIGWIDVRLRVNGDVVPCDTCHWVLGNVMRSSLEEVWNGPGFREFRAAARRPGGISDSPHACCCDYCCHILASRRMHRWLKWLAPFAPPQREIRP